MKATRSLPCDLSPKEYEARSGQLAQKLGEKEEILERKKATSDRHNGERKEVEAEIARLGRICREKKENRDVEVRIEKTEKRLVVTRLDNGTVVEDRPLRGDELQEGLFDGEPAKGKGKTKMPHGFEPAKGKKSKRGTKDASDQL